MRLAPTPSNISTTWTPWTAALPSTLRLPPPIPPLPLLPLPPPLMSPKSPSTWLDTWLSSTPGVAAINESSVYQPLRSSLWIRLHCRWQIRMMWRRIMKVPRRSLAAMIIRLNLTSVCGRMDVGSLRAWSFRQGLGRVYWLSCIGWGGIGLALWQSFRCFICGGGLGSGFPL